MMVFFRPACCERIYHMFGDSIYSLENETTGSVLQ